MMKLKVGRQKRHERIFDHGDLNVCQSCSGIAYLEILSQDKSVSEGC